MIPNDKTAAPAAEVLGVIDPKITTLGPQRPQASWGSPGQELNLSEAPPPWELEDERSASDARRFVTVPLDWSLRWINPKVLESSGWRFWQPVMVSDSRVQVKVPSLVSPDNTVRRGGDVGDILAWMPTHWVEARRRIKDERTAVFTRGSLTRQEQLKEDFGRGKFGRGVTLDSAKHPTHTIGEGRSMKD